MEIWDWKPCISIGPIRFGMNRQVARNILKQPFKENIENGTPTDDLGFLKIYYNNSNKVVCVKIIDNIQVLYNKKAIFPAQINNIDKCINTLKVDSENCILFDYNKQIVASYDPDDGLLDYISVARSNYFGGDD